MRNLLLIHLESLNMLNYRINKEFFPTLEEIEKKSVTFLNYYSSATSTLMVLADLAYKGAYVNETLRAMEWKRCEEIDGISLLDEFVNKGYRVQTMCYPPNGVDAQTMNENNFIGKKVSLVEYEDLQEYNKEVIDILDGGEPFVLWLCNFTSHVGFNLYVSAEKGGVDRWDEGYRSLNDYVCYIFGLLRERNLLANTTVVFYGDHGDDIFSHGYHGGLVHAIEPYEQLIHTPMFIYDERFMPETKLSVASTGDIGYMVERLFEMPDVVPDTEEFPIPARTYAFSRNMFAAQKVREELFGKGYSVSDGRFLLLVDSGGLAMYEIKMDPTCQNNLLLFYEFVDGKLVLCEKTTALKFHFKHLMDGKTFETIEYKFYELKNVLYRHVSEIYEHGECVNRLYEMAFDTIARPTKEKFFSRCFAGKKVILYGAGEYGDFCYNHIKDMCNVVAWVDQKYEEYKECNGYKITKPETIQGKDFDIIYISIANGKVMQTVYDMLIKWGIEKTKIV